MFHGNIEKLTLDNNDYRRVLFTGKYSQLVLMSLKPKEEIGKEIHNDIDQFFRFEKGNGVAIVGDKKYSLTDGVAIIIPAGTEHNIINTGDQPLKLYTIYSPANHKPGTIQHNKPIEHREYEAAKSIYKKLLHGTS